MASVRCKMVCKSVTTVKGGDQEILMHPVSDGSPENKQFFSGSTIPYGELKIGLVKSCYNRFTPGNEYYIDITLVE